MGLINGFRRGVGEVADFYRRTGSEFIENGLTGARKQMSKSWKGGLVKQSGGIKTFAPGMSKTGKAMTVTAGYQGYRKVRDPGHNVPLVPFL
jgi:hypothetical protein